MQFNLSSQWPGSESRLDTKCTQQTWVTADHHRHYRTVQTHQAIEIYRFLFALVCVPPFVLPSSLFLFFPLDASASGGLSALDWPRPFMLAANAIGLSAR